MMIKRIFIIVCLLMLQACAVGPRFHVNIDSISAPKTMPKHSYILLPGTKEVDDSDLQFREYASYVQRALAEKGFVKTNNFNEANIAIFLMYGIGDPQKHQYTYSLPLWGQTGVSSSSTYGTVNTYGSTATYSGTTTYTPSYGVVGSTMHTGTRVTYFRYFILDALDLDEYRRTKKEVQLWKTTVTSTGSSGDLRQVLPVMIGASKEYFGTNTGKKLKVILHENDKRVLQVKGIEKN